MSLFQDLKRAFMPEPVKVDTHSHSFVRPPYIPDADDIKYPDDEITPPNVCHMNEGDVLCAHRSVNTGNILLAASKLGYEVTGETLNGTHLERCHYQPDYDHYPVRKL